ncbi:MAG TPA: diaminopimelate decarboxylase [Anaerolineae bacterium]|nr:diaminopimelate decarboxylase [Anaerolineae bacterium]
MTGFVFHDQQWWCDAAPIDLLADRHGTPLYVYSRARIIESYNRVATAFKPLNAHLHYSVKANSSGAILRVLHDLGAGFDVVSGGELFRVLKIGADPASIVFAGVGKTRAELEYALKNKVGWINVESVQELEVLNDLAGDKKLETSIALRVNPSIEAETHEHIATGGHRSKFGLDLDEARSVLAQSDRFPRLNVTGLHMHIGSQLATADRTVEALKKLLDLAQDHSIQMLDIGGGFPVRYHPTDDYPDPIEFANMIFHTLASPLASRPLQLIIEPGRSIVADAGALIAEVQYVKQRESRRIIVINASMTELIRPALYDAYHHIVAAQPRDDTHALADIVGPVCESADVLGIDREFPEIRRGDRVMIMTTGAYGSSMASNYNSRPRPAEVMVDGAKSHLIRRRETWNDLVALEE